MFKVSFEQTASKQKIWKIDLILSYHQQQKKSTQLQKNLLVQGYIFQEFITDYIILIYLNYRAIQKEIMAYFYNPELIQYYTNYSFYYVPQIFDFSSVNNGMAIMPQNSAIEQNQSSAPERTSENQKESRGVETQIKISQNSIQQNLKYTVQKPVNKHKNFTQIKLNFRTQWKNENRNIVPNIINQMVSFLQKKKRSQKLINQIFKTYPHDPNWKINKFYLYMRRIKESANNYMNENVLLCLFDIHEPKCEIYPKEEQQYYMRACRIAASYFLANDSVIITLTSTKMCQKKRITHLIARDALRRKFLELAHDIWN